MSFDEIVHEGLVEYEEKAEQKTTPKCWCGGNTAKGTIGDMRLVCLESVWHDPGANGQPTAIRTLYVAGPMTGYAANNYPAFNEATHELRKVGFEVVNPAEFGANSPASYVELLKRDLHALLECDGVAVIDKWWESVGARNEVQVAGLLKMPVRSLAEWVQIKTGR
jgi:hypothetical protein